MARCTRTSGLEVHHIDRTRGNALSNARALCQACHANTGSYGQPGTSPPDFDEETRRAALVRAGYRCECTSTACSHH